MRYEVYGNNKNFDKKKEIQCLENYLNFIVKSLSEKNYSQFKLINSIKEMIYKTGIKNENQFYISVFKLTQKLNLFYQKEVINSMIIILKNDEENKIKNFKNFIDEVKEYNKLKSIYLKIEDIKNMIINYINKLIKMQK